MESVTVMRQVPGNELSIFSWFLLRDEIPSGLKGLRLELTRKIFSLRFSTSESSMIKVAVPKSVSVIITAVRFFPLI